MVGVGVIDIGLRLLFVVDLCCLLIVVGRCLLSFAHLHVFCCWCVRSFVRVIVCGLFGVVVGVLVWYVMFVVIVVLFVLLWWWLLLLLLLLVGGFADLCCMLCDC